MSMAEQLLMNDITKMSKALDGLKLNQNQYDSLCSFIYNVGVGAFSRSTLKKLVSCNSTDPLIKGEFMKWKKAGGKVNQGLINRRTDESNLYDKD
jgi:lysozyme